MPRVVLAMSGGVDSSVAAHLLRQAGHEVIGLFMRHAHPDACQPAAGGPDPLLPVIEEAPAPRQGCCTASDAADARRVADRLDIPFYALNFQEQFGRIMDYFVDEYTAGRTPNPCVMCNNWLKFGKLFEYADSVQAQYVATGHYARIEPAAGGGPPALLRGLDDSKDQSYVLFGIDRAVLPRLMFPIGGYRKQAIRQLARGLNLRVADKKDSQEICFVPGGDYASLVRRRRGGSDLSGEIVTTTGELVGRHQGIENYTIGQRKGLGIALGQPRYVVRLERGSRRVVIGSRSDLSRSHFSADRANWLLDPPRQAFDCTVKIRYKSAPAMATIRPAGSERFEVELHEPRDGIAPGQAVVCYDGDRVLGGGWID